MLQKKNTHTQPSTPTAFREHFAKCHTTIQTCLPNDDKSKSAPKTKKNPPGEIRRRNLAIGGNDEKTDDSSEQEYTNKQKRTKQWEVSYRLASPLPHTMGPAVRGVCEWAVFCVWMYGPGAEVAELTSEISNFQRMSFLDCATCAKSPDEWVCVRARERERTRVCVWLTGVCVRQGWMWTHVESHHQIYWKER